MTTMLEEKNEEKRFRHSVMPALKKQALAQDKDFDGSEWEVVVIEGGRTLNGQTFPSSTLITAAALFEGSPIYAYQWQEKLGHLDPEVQERFPNGIFSNLVGEIKNVRWDDKRRVLLGTAFIDDQPTRDFLLNRWQRDPTSMVGLSIDAEGFEKAGVVTRLVKANSVDIVTFPAAGGRFDRLVAAIKDEMQTQIHPEPELAQPTLESNNNPESGGNEMSLKATIQSLEQTLAGPASSWSDEDKAPLLESLELHKQQLEIEAQAEEVVEEAAPEVKAEEVVADTVPEAPAEIKEEAPVAPPVADVSPLVKEMASLRLELDTANKTIVEAEAKQQLAQKKFRDQAISYALAIEGEKLNIIDMDAAAVLMDVSAVSVDDNGVVTGLKESLKSLTEAKPWLVKKAEPRGQAVKMTESVEDASPSATILRRITQLEPEIKRGNVQAIGEARILKRKYEAGLA